MTAETHPYPSPPPEGEGKFFCSATKIFPFPLRGKVGMGVG